MPISLVTLIFLFFSPNVLGTPKTCQRPVIFYIPFGTSFYAPFKASEIEQKASWKVFVISEESRNNIRSVLSRWRFGIFSAADVRAKILIDGREYLIDAFGGVKSGWKIFRVDATALEAAIQGSAIDLHYVALIPKSDKVITIHTIEASASINLQVSLPKREFESFAKLIVAAPSAPKRHEFDHQRVRALFIINGNKYFIDQSGTVYGGQDLGHLDIPTLQEQLGRFNSSDHEKCILSGAIE